MTSLPPAASLVGRLFDESLNQLLVSGGDCRMHIDAVTGLSKYGCAPHRRAAVEFGSCTASSPIDIGLDAARNGLGRLRDAARDGGEAAIDEVAATLFEEVRTQLAAELGLSDAATKVVFCPSGTDAEMLALALVRSDSEQPVVNIVVGPAEVGSGTTFAAGGRHFQVHVPSGPKRSVGAHIDATLGDAVHVHTVVLRDDDGEPLSSEMLDAQAEALVAGAIEDGARVVLHVVAHSKTGVHAPSIAQVEYLRKRFGNALTILLDAAQGRISRRGLQDAVDRGYLVLLTGSKFYGGPPFSGALLVPPALWPQTSGLSALPDGLRDYLSPIEVPPTWRAARASLTARPNVGLVLRWMAALAQLKAYYALDGEARLAVMRTWESAVPEILGDAAGIRLFPVQPLHAPDAERLLESKTTVFPFFLQRRDADEPLDKPALTRVFHWLNRDLSGVILDASVPEKALLAREIHIGQPVLLSGNATPERSVLRVALGAPLIIQVVEDQTLGPTFAARLTWLRSQLEMLRGKLGLICTHYDALTAHDRDNG